MKQLIIACYCICILVACSRKTAPSKPNYTLGNNSNKIENNPAVVSDSATIKTVPADSAATATGTVMVIADGYGKLITPQQSLPNDGSIKYNNLQLSRGFTPQQRANLHARYQTIPPRVLYVPDQYSLSSLKGSYYIYKKKFWYWKKSDGLYYLDQKYYL
ncbi:MAG TPA: hypothetical protein VFW07_12310 [Parafilimonas sp.]|nr:hypothetical protein [Parafilimonas sp.]